MKLHRIVIATAVVASTLAPRTSTAQQTSRIVLTPYAGAFLPAVRLADQNDLGIKQQPALALGLNGSYWFNDRFGLELGGVYAFSDAKATQVGSGGVPGFLTSTSEGSYVLMGSAKLMFNLIPLTERAALRLGVGPAIINRGGNAYKADAVGDYSGLTDIGGAVSLCSRIPLTDFLSVRLRAEDYLYQSKLRFRSAGSSTGDMAFGSKVQSDFIFSAGLQLVFWR